MKIFDKESIGLDFFEFGYGLILLPIIFFVTKKWNSKFFNLNFDKKYLYISIILGVVFTISQPILLNILHFIIGLKSIPFYIKLTDFEVFKSKFALNFISMIILLPIAEEMFFRGLIQGKLNKYFSGWMAITFTSLLFGVGHLNIEKIFYDLKLDYNWAYITFIMAIISGFLFNKTKSLIPSIIFHITANLMVVLI